MYLESTRGLYIVAATLSGFALKSGKICGESTIGQKRKKVLRSFTVILVSCTEENVL